MAGPACGYAGEGFPSRCISQYRLSSPYTRQKFHARPEQGNGPAADGASFSHFTSNLLECESCRFSSARRQLRGTENGSRAWRRGHIASQAIQRVRAEYAARSAHHLIDDAIAKIGSKGPSLTLRSAFGGSSSYHAQIRCRGIARARKLQAFLGGLRHARDCKLDR
jgi:hypothetical protein